MNEAYTYFCGPVNKDFIDYANFERSINILFPGRFHPSDIDTIWQQLAGNDASLDKVHFNYLYPESKKQSI